MRMRIALLLPAIALAACTASVENTNTDGAMVNDGVQHMTLPESSGVDIAQSEILFTGKSNIVNHQGNFERFAMSITRDASAPQDVTKATMEATIDISSVKTDSEGLDGHFQRPDFFDTVNHPTATFRSTQITANDDGTFTVMGDLTMKGVTHPFSFLGTSTENGMMLNGEIPRRDFGIANDSYKDKLLEPLVPVTVKVVFSAE